MSPFTRFAMLVVMLAAPACTSAVAPSLEDAGSGADAPALDAFAADSGPPTTTVSPRVVLLARDGRVVVTDVETPWATRGTLDLRAPIASARCRAGRCVAVHPSPTDALATFASDDASEGAGITLAAGADPRDVALVDDHTAVVSQWGTASLLVVDLDSHAQREIDLASVADDDGLPEAGRLAFCGRRVFVQLARVDHATGAASALAPAIAAVDLDSGAITLAMLTVAAAFDMPIDCDAGWLRVAEPRQVLTGGSRYDEIDLATMSVHALDLPATAEVGGFVYADESHAWTITHTDFGPGASSHLDLVGSSAATYNTFGAEHVDDLAYDAPTDLVFFPDNCAPEHDASCERGLAPFHAHDGTRASERSIDVGIPPVEIVVSR